MNAQQYLDKLNKDYLTVHQDKEALFWQTYMGTSDDHDGAANAEAKWTNYISNPDLLNQVRGRIEDFDKTNNNQDQKALMGLQGWLSFFEANCLESQQSQESKAELIELESALFEKRQNYLMYFENEKGEKIEATTPVLAANISSNAHEVVRLSSHQALLDLEQWVLNNGFIELVKKRNGFAKLMGYDSFFDYAIEKTEQMTTKELFTILDDFEAQTKTQNLKSIHELASKKGDQVLLGHNFKYSYAGDSTALLDPYVSFDQSLKQWVDSFGRLGIDYSQAQLQLDLLNRKGKYANGFCHGPMPSFYDNDQWVPAQVNFTSNSQPGQVGSGYAGLATLFHEGGHAAHFSNVKLNSPCFSQEFAPTSMAYAETQSMFLDSLIADGDWLTLYAKNNQGQAVSKNIIKQLVEEKQPFRAYEERSILVVPYFERALYELADKDLTAENITALARQCEKKILGLNQSPRPLLAIPHLLSDQSACSYQGYLLANMAVYQTRHYFLEKDGYLTDNPNIGPALAKHYWHGGNSTSHNQTIESLTGEGFNASYLAQECNLSTEDALAIEDKKIAASIKRAQPEIQNLNASIKIVDGINVLADNQISMEKMCEDFSSYVQKQIG